MRIPFCHNLSLSVLVVLFVNVSFSQQATIKGKVSYRNENLQGATVSLAHKTIAADQNGEFYFSVNPGTYTLTITHSVYKKFQQIVIAYADSTLRVDVQMILGGVLEEVILTGTRSKNIRTNLNTPVPVDVISQGKLVETGQISLTQILNFIAPSFNASREVLHESAALRGMDPQQTLILINGIRYHSMAWVYTGNLRGQLGKGSAGNDLNSIPFPAIEKIEIMRDGAAAQYGSDAIAGVINIILKKTTGETILQTHTGQFHQGDGEKFLVGLYHGFLLKKKGGSADRPGFMTLSAYYRNQAPTLRSGTYDGLVYKNYPAGATNDDKLRIKMEDELLVQTRGFNRKAVIDNTGNTKLTGKGFVVNGGYPINKSTEFSGTFIINSRKLDRAALFRFPRDSSRINFHLYPDGFQPRNKSNTVDVSSILGIKSKTQNNWEWEIINAYGINSVKSHSTNTNNASQTYILGANAQSSFYTGTDIFKQLTTDVNFVKKFYALNLGWGAEWRLENYHSKIGEEASWYNYDPANYRTGGIGAPGPENAVNKTRNVLGAYSELEAEIKSGLLFNVAARYEYYSDFGSAVAGKLAARYKFSKQFLLRASINNGFRAPGLQQRYLTSISETITPTRTLAIGGIFPNDHNVIKALGIPLLTPEKSLNISTGFTSSFLQRFHIAIDAYWIQVKERVVLSGRFDRIPGNRLDAILDLYPEFIAITSISFFSNAINTRTKGIDVVLDGYWANKKESMAITIAANFNSTRIYGPIKTSDTLATINQSSSTLFNSEEIVRMERGQPGSKIIMSFTYNTGKIKLHIRNTRFGETMIANLQTPIAARPETFSPKILTDISLTYTVKQIISITFGANNIANIYPDRLKYYENTSQGSWIYSPEASPFGFNGSYYYLGVNFDL